MTNCVIRASCDLPPLKSGVIGVVTAEALSLDMATASCEEHWEMQHKSLVRVSHHYVCALLERGMDMIASGRFVKLTTPSHQDKPFDWTRSRILALLKERGLWHSQIAKSQRGEPCEYLMPVVSSKRNISALYNLSRAHEEQTFPEILEIGRLEHYLTSHPATDRNMATLVAAAEIDRLAADRTRGSHCSTDNNTVNQSREAFSEKLRKMRAAEDNASALCSMGVDGEGGGKTHCGPRRNTSTVVNANAKYHYMKPWMTRRQASFACAQNFSRRMQRHVLHSTEDLDIVNFLRRTEICRFPIVDMQFLDPPKGVHREMLVLGWLLWTTLGHPRPLWAALGLLGGALGRSWALWLALGRSGVLWAALGRCGRSAGIWWASLGVLWVCL